MKTKKIKFAGPSKKMMDALKNEGLNISWPKTVKDENDLEIEGTYYTGINDYEKGVLIDLRDTFALGSKAGVDNAIAHELQEAYEDYNIEEEILNLQGTESERRARGVPEATYLLEDLKEAEKCLERFADVANAVAEGREILAKEDNEEITIKGKDAKRVADILEKIAYWKKSGPWNHEEQAFAKMIVDELRNKIKEG
jgi:hypothetical protein